MGLVERGKWVMGIEEGTCWDEHLVLYGNQFDNKFHIKKIKIKRSPLSRRKTIPCGNNDLYKGIQSIKNEGMKGAPGWLSQLSGRLWLRS